MKIHAKGGRYSVPSQSVNGGRYWVDPAEKSCDCPDFELRQLPCKHVLAVELVIKRETVVAPDGTTTVTETKGVRVTYSQPWAAYNQAQTTEEEHFCRLLRDLVSGVETPEQKGAGRRRVPWNDQVFACAYKVYSGFSGRRFMTAMREAANGGFVSKAPHYNSMFDFMDCEEVTPILRDLVERSSLPLAAVETDFAIDSTGFGTSVFFRHYTNKYGRQEKWHDWIKVHAVCGVKTGIVTSVEATFRETGDAPYFKPLVEETARNFKINEVSADKAYLSRQNLDVVDRLGGTAYIPFKSNSRADSSGHAVWQKLFHLFSLHRETWLEHYHKRSNVESVFSAIKRVFGGNLRSRTPNAQINEALLKVLCHNLRCLIHAIHELGIDPTFGLRSA